MATLQLGLLEMVQRAPPAETDYTRTAGMEPGPDQPQAGVEWAQKHHAQSRLYSEEKETTFFLRFCLCTNKDMIPPARTEGHVSEGEQPAPKVGAPDVSRLVPHIVYVSKALQKGELGTGERWLKGPVLHQTSSEGQIAGPAGLEPDLLYP